MSKSSVKKSLTKLQKLSLWSYSNPRKTALIWLAILLFGVACYSTLLKREGFPSINSPLSLATGSYLVNDAARVDSQVAGPFSDTALKQTGTKSVKTQSFGNFYVATISYKDSYNAKATGQKISDTIKAQGNLPASATINISPLEFGFTTRGDDLVISYYSNTPSTSMTTVTAKAEQAAKYLKAQNIPLVKNVSIINPYESATNPVTGEIVTSQRTFDIFGKRVNNQIYFRNSVIIGVKAEKGTDNIKLDNQVEQALNKLNSQPEFAGYSGVVSGTFKGQIKQQINELQKTLLEGLFVILIVGSLVIAVRASVVTVLSLFTVIAAVNGFLYLIGYSLNTITLFGLILSLSLIVDDTIIMVEAIDTQRRRQTDPKLAVTEATKRVSRAMISATTTAALSFAPLIFVGGILGSFIRAIPITIIAALVTSLVVALVFIPLFARFFLLSKKHMGESNVKEMSAGIEAAIARFVSGPMLWAKNSTLRLVEVGLIAIVIGFGFIFAGGVIFQKVTFNIFPSSKDGNQLTTTITYRPNTDIDEAQKIAKEVNVIVGRTTGSNYIQSSYYGQADVKSATQTIDIIDYNQRKETAPQFVAALNAEFKNFPDASVKARQNDAGPPAADFAIQIDSSKDRADAIMLAESIADYVRKTPIKRPDGKTVKIDSVEVANTSIYTRNNGKQYVAVNVKYIDTDTTTLVSLTKKAVNKQFDANKLASYGLTSNAISYNAGQEDENQNSFKTLAIAFPALLLVIYIVLAFQFRSFLQPALIFMAIPFSFFGVTLGLWLTNNAFSFFAMLGFFALIGLSLKNTILLTDYANQARKMGMHPVDAAHEALAERFRPLIATSLTAVFSLIPLALSSPFWQGLAVVLIFGLLSSTFLVVTVFPYYYLGAEYLRIKSHKSVNKYIRRKA
jgi:multidrug efflux pump subunit AcrB